eukprot:gnl/MRDRNA2_/MRDRNA2_85029_c0_seq1.p1 gnl/MRDRNA2_/MRDRNA2_85029_c0~~gnl/MRDRNA2_/MRDRNA2_85029_c0_seq1.p1  ORF type:complete len:116 (+),score=24.29 gnl/MRDRNA2_/MRDRNA2_85029_c0_seq1:122-469(+)
MPAQEIAGTARSFARSQLQFDEPLLEAIAASARASLHGAEASHLASFAWSVAKMQIDEVAVTGVGRMKVVAKFNEFCSFNLASAVWKHGKPSSDKVLVAIRMCMRMVEVTFSSTI